MDGREDSSVEVESIESLFPRDRPGDFSGEGWNFNPKVLSLGRCSVLGRPELPNALDGPAELDASFIGVDDDEDIDIDPSRDGVCEEARRGTAVGVEREDELRRGIPGMGPVARLGPSGNDGKSSCCG